MTKHLPKHIGIIMDGNGRWAENKELPKKIGHKQGAKALRELVEEINKNLTEIKHITVYAFSTENWKRPKKEVDYLMKLLGENLKKYIKDNEKSNIKIDIIGDRQNLAQNLLSDIEILEEISKEKSGLNLHIALNYGGRDEIVRAFKKTIENYKNGNIDSDDITQEYISSILDTKNIVDPELIIRTSGEFRLSNFLTWQSAYSEFYFSDKLWPDFNFIDLKEALNSYMNRERRFGGRVEGLENGH